MPLFNSLVADPQTKIYFWKITEPVSFFLERLPWDPLQLQWLDSIHPHKKLEYMASRYLIFEQTGKLDAHLYKDESGKLHFQDENAYLSISHSGDYVALIVSNSPAGVDIQMHQSKILSIANRFLSTGEKDWLKSNDAWNIQNLCVCWCIKESIYKANGQKGIHFSDQIFLNPEIDRERSFSIRNAKLSTAIINKNYEIHFSQQEEYSWAAAIEESTSPG